MDGPDLDQARHIHALEALARVNRISGVAPRIWREILHLSQRNHDRRRDRPIRLLDVACGGGDVLLDISRRARAAGVPLEIHGCDVSPAALEHARDEAQRQGVAADFFARDAVTEGLPGGYDLISSSLFLHHLGHKDAVTLLRGMATAGRSVLVQDLLRGRIGYMMAWAGLRLLSRSEVARVDGPRSVQAAFNLPEVRAMAVEAGLSGGSLSNAAGPRGSFSDGAAPDPRRAARDRPRRTILGRGGSRCGPLRRHGSAGALS